MFTVENFILINILFKNYILTSFPEYYFEQVTKKY